MSIDRPDRNDRAMHSRGSCDMCKWCGIVSAAGTTLSELGRRFGVNRKTPWLIVRGLSYTDIV